MPIRLVAKRSSESNAIPKVDELVEGELALNTADGSLYTKMVDGSILRLNSQADLEAIADRIQTLESRVDELVGEAGYIEYGEWVPTVGTAGGTTVVQPDVDYDIQYGLYSRVGTQVTVNGRLRFTATNGQGNALVLFGLPFKHTTVQNSSTDGAISMQGAGSVGFAGGTSAIKPLFLWGAGGNAAWFGKHVDGTDNQTSISFFAPSEATGLIDIVFSYTYHTLSVTD
jgi:hypothetical protein